MRKRISMWLIKLSYKINPQERLSNIESVDNYEARKLGVFLVLTKKEIKDYRKKKKVECNQLHSFIFQCKRVNQCSLEYPIILDDVGQIADGYHRLCKAILEGKETIKAIRLLEMPAPDRVENK